MLSRVLRDSLKAFDAWLHKTHDLVRLDKFCFSATEFLEEFVCVRGLSHQRENLDTRKIWLRHAFSLSVDAG